VLNARPETVAITLVHGTFVRHAEWANESSLLRHTLMQLLGDGVRFYRFEWSGGNTHRDRTQAADLLTEHLLQRRASDVSRKHFIIAHSHAGNIVLYALRNPEVARTITGFVTLGTPFLNCTRRRLTLIEPLLGMGLWMTLMACCIVAESGWLMLALGLIGPVYGLRRLCGSSKFRLWNPFSWPDVFAPSLRRLQAKLFRRLSLQPPDGTPILCLNATHDEALVWLRFLNSCSRAVLMVVHPRILVAVAVALLLFWSAEVYNAIKIKGDLGDVFVGMPVWFGIWYGSLCLVAIAIHMFVNALILAGPFGFGRKMAFATLLLRFDVTARLPCSASAVAGSYEDLAGSGLRHTRICRDDVVAADIAKWVATCG
jgi:hypothetical protein